MWLVAKITKDSMGHAEIDLNRSKNSKLVASLIRDS